MGGPRWPGSSVGDWEILGARPREALARAADVPYSTVVKVETGQIRNPSWSVVIALAKAVSADLDVLAACPLPTDPGPGRGGLRKKTRKMN